jgi:hypothetical protein
MAKNPNHAEPEGGGGGEFESFLRAVQTLLPLLCQQIRSHCPEKDREPVMGLYDEALQNAWSGSMQELLQYYHRLDPTGRAELDNAVRISGMLTLVEHATSLVSSGRLVSAAALLDLGTIIEKIKAFIQCILNCFGINICILNCLFILIDNIFGLFVAPVSREYADYYFAIEKQAAEVRLLMLREQKLRKGCSCGGASDRE